MLTYLIEAIKSKSMHTLNLTGHYTELVESMINNVINNVMKIAISQREVLNVNKKEMVFEYTCGWRGGRGTNDGSPVIPVNSLKLVASLVLYVE